MYQHFCHPLHFPCDNDCDCDTLTVVHSVPEALQSVSWDRSCLHRTLLITAKARSNRRFPYLSTVTKPLKDLQTCLYARKTTQLPQKHLLKLFQWTLKVWWVQRVSFSCIQMSLDWHFGPGRYTSLQALCKVWCCGGQPKLAQRNMHRDYNVQHREGNKLICWSSARERLRVSD